jgi:hypothetical protein
MDESTRENGKMARLMATVLKFDQMVQFDTMENGGKIHLFATRPTLPKIHLQPPLFNNYPRRARTNWNQEMT